MPPKHTKHRLQPNPVQPDSQANPRKVKERNSEKILEKRSLNDAKLGIALDVILDGLDEAAARLRRVDFCLNKRQWEEVCNLAQALGLTENEAIIRSVDSSSHEEIADACIRIKQHTVTFEVALLEAAGGSADDEFKDRAERHKARRAKNLLKKKVQRYVWFFQQRSCTNPSQR